MIAISTGVPGMAKMESSSGNGGRHKMKDPAAIAR